MTIQAIEARILELLVNFIQVEGSNLAAEFLEELINLIKRYIPTSNLCTVDKISWVDIRNTLETNISSALLQAIAALIASFVAKTTKLD